MEKEKLLYQIKTLDQMILRSLCEDQENKKMPDKITVTQMQIIHYILEQKEKEVYQKELEEVLSLRRATVSGVLHTMEKNRLIDRVTSKKDSRVKQIILNKQTKEMFDQKKKRLEEIERKITKNLSQEEVKTFLEVISKMKDNLKKEGIIG